MSGSEIIEELVRRLGDKNIRCHDEAILAELRKMKSADIQKMVGSNKTK